MGLGLLLLGVGGVGGCPVLYLTLTLSSREVATRSGIALGINLILGCTRPLSALIKFRSSPKQANETEVTSSTHSFMRVP